MVRKRVLGGADGMLQCLNRMPNTAKTSRMTENKRRYRARRKEYVSDLERRLAEAREQGVNATMEVQSAARKVVEENGRLRELLRLAGFADEETVDGRLPGSGKCLAAIERHRSNTGSARERGFPTSCATYRIGERCMTGTVEANAPARTPPLRRSPTRLRAVEHRNRLSDKDHAALNGEIRRIEEHYFLGDGSREPDLSKIARTWVKKAS